jgi:hypothetical protein
MMRMERACQAAIQLVEIKSQNEIAL